MKKFFALTLALVLALSLAACGGKDSGGSAPADTQTPADSGAPADSAPAETVKLKVAASPTPHAEILAQCVDVLKEQGIELQVTEYADYVVPNTAVEDGDEDANYFQHITLP